jgi:hypothetical protein
MVNKNKSHTGTNFSKVIGCILAVLFIAWPCSALTVPEGETFTVNIDDGEDYLTVLNMGTANLYPGANIYGGILALSGGTINFYGGEMGEGSYLFAIGYPQITVYGTNFEVYVEVNGQMIEHEFSGTFFTLSPGRYYTLKGIYGNGEPINLKFCGGYIPINLVTVALESGMTIDIKPGNEQNNINLKSNGVVPVAALTTDDFDAATIDPATAEFAGAAPKHWSLEDVDGDGDDDVIFHFRTQELNLDENSTEATLTAQLASSPLMSQMTSRSAAQTSGGTVVSGTDAVKIVAAKKSKK